MVIFTLFNKTELDTIAVNPRMQKLKIVIPMFEVHDLLNGLQY